MTRPRRLTPPPPLTVREQAILVEWGEKLRALYTGEREPQTAAQVHFVQATHGKARPNSIYETAFIKWLQLEQFKRAQERLRIEVRDARQAQHEQQARAALEMQRRRELASRQEPRTQPQPEAAAPNPARPRRSRRRRPVPEVVQRTEPSDIPEYEEGYPRPGWYTDEDWRKMHPGRR